jgi:hypothetical protein
MKASIIAITILLSCSSNAVAQTRSLRLMAIEGGTDINRVGIGCGWAGEPFIGIVERADILVLGTVGATQSYLTADEADIFTDFVVHPEQVLLQRVVLSSEKPAPAAPLVFKTVGGTVTIAGYRLSHSVSSNSRSVTLQRGDRVMLFARYDPRDKKWLFFPTDVFAIDGDIVINNLPPIAPFTATFPPRLSVADFAARVRDLAARVRPAN